MSEQEIAEVTVENTQTVEEVREQLRKAEAKIVEMKKSTTPVVEEPVVEVKTETVGFDEEAFERKYEEKKFFESNPDMLEYKDKILEKKALGNSWSEAKLLVENSDETIANRKVASQTNFTSGDTPSTTTYTQEEVSKMPIEARKRAWEQAKEGKVQIT